MEIKYKELIKIMDILIELHRKLLTVEESKLEAIVDQDWKKLQVLLKESEFLLQEIDRVEDERLNLLKLVRPDGNVNISELTGVLSEELRNNLEKSRNNLLKVIESLKEINEKTKTLLEGSLEIVNFTLGLFSNTSGRVKTYGGSGKEVTGEFQPSSMVFDFKA